MSELSIWDVDGTIRPGSLTGESVISGIELGIFDPTRFNDPANPHYGEVPYYMEALAQQSRRHFNELMDKISDEARDQAYGFALQMTAEQDHVLALSHSPDFLVKAFARGLGTINHARGSYFHTKDLVFSGRARTLHKVRAANRYVREKGLVTIAFAAGDSVQDEPVLLKAERAIVVNPDSKLLSVANRRGWEVIRTDE